MNGHSVFMTDCNSLGLMSGPPASEVRGHSDQLRRFNARSKFSGHLDRCINPTPN